MVSAPSSVTTANTKASMAHPLDPLTPAEIKGAVAAVRAFLKKGGAEGARVNPLFNSISLREPPKYDMLRWTGLFTPKEIAAAAPKHKAAPIRRQADVSTLHCLPILGGRSPLSPN